MKSPPAQARAPRLGREGEGAAGARRGAGEREGSGRANERGVVSEICYQRLLPSTPFSDRNQGFRVRRRLASYECREGTIKIGVHQKFVFCVAGSRIVI